MSGKRPCVVVGTGGHARAVLAVLAETEQPWQCDAIIDLNDDGANQYRDTEILGARIERGIANIKTHCDRGTRQVFLAIGDGKDRRRAFDHCDGLGCEMPNLISKHSLVGLQTTMGRANFIGPRAFIGPQCRIGDNNILNTSAVIEHEVVIGDDCHIAPGAILAGRVVVGSKVFVGVGARIIDRLAIGSAITIGAGGVVIQPLDEPGVYVGIPVRKLR